MRMLASQGRHAIVEDREAQADVALIDVGPIAAAPLVPRTPDDVQAVKTSRRLLEAALAPLTTLKAPSVVLVGDEAQARTAVARGARGALRRTIEPHRLLAALEAVSAGLTVVDFALVHAPAEGESDAHLTDRERQVLDLIVQGFSNRRIAKRLGISEHTAKFHVNGILAKLGAGTRTEAVVAAARRGLVAL